MAETISIALAVSLISIAITVWTFSRNKTKDDKSDGRQDGVVLTEIGYIKSGIDDIKSEQREMRKTNDAFRERLAKVEASAKQAHLRIDRIEEREYPSHEKGEHEI